MMNMNRSEACSLSKSRTRAVYASACPRGKTSPTIWLITGWQTILRRWCGSCAIAACTCGLPAIPAAMSEVIFCKSTASTAVLCPLETAEPQPATNTMVIAMNVNRIRCDIIPLHPKRESAYRLPGHVHLVGAREDLLARLQVGDEEIEQKEVAGAVGQVVRLAVESEVRLDRRRRRIAGSGA